MQKTSASLQEVQENRLRKGVIEPNLTGQAKSLSPGVPGSFGERENRCLGLPSVIVGAVLAVRIAAGSPSRGIGSPRESDADRDGACWGQRSPFSIQRGPDSPCRLDLLDIPIFSGSNGNTIPVCSR